MFLLLKPHKQIIHCVYYRGCEVVQDYNKSQTVHFFCFIENNLPYFFFSSVSLTFLFEFNIFSNEILETEHSHLSNGSLLIS